MGDGKPSACRHHRIECLTKFVRTVRVAGLRIWRNRALIRPDGEYLARQSASVAVFACDAHANWYAGGGENKNHLIRGGLYNQVWGKHMQTLFKTLLVGAILAIGTGSALAADAVVGTWKLNLAKSTFSPGPAPKSQTRNYVESAQGLTVTVKTTAADGKESTTTLTYKEDGKPYP
jgi:hypothetical protein